MTVEPEAGPLDRRFIEQSRTYLTADYLPKIRRAVDSVSEEDVWWRPNAASNSIGHLLLHLAGNLRQWVVTGLGGTPDRRRRELEFAPETRPPTDELMHELSNAVSEADSVLALLDPAILSEERIIQGKSVSGFVALYHAVEHFSMHCGQILYIAKLRIEKDLGFYEVVEGIPHARWLEEDEES